MYASPLGSRLLHIQPVAYGDRCHAMSAHHMYSSHASLQRTCVDLQPQDANGARRRFANGTPGKGDSTILVKEIAQLLRQQSQTVCVAETSAGGLIAASLLAEPGASAYFAGSVVCYSSESKRQLLCLEKSHFTATEPHALDIARAAQGKLDSDWAIGESGVAGPTPNSRGVAPGVCALAVIGPNGVKLTKTIWPNTELSAADAYGQPPKVQRSDAMTHFAEEALRLLLDAIRKQ